MAASSLSPYLAEIVRLDDTQLGALLDSLTEQEAQAILYDWRVFARPEQLPPPGHWTKWLILAGRGFGKTRSALELVRAEVEAGRARRVALVAETAADGRDVLAEGESGLLAISPPWFRPKYEPSKRRITWPNGAIATLYSAEDPEQLRGPQHDLALADEIGKWRYRATFDNLMLGLRLGEAKLVAATTPRPTELVRELLSDPSVVVTRGTTYDNLANLSANFKNHIIRRYEGTRLGRQELLGQLLEDNPDALWRLKQLDALRVTMREVPDLERLVIGVDPAVTSGEDSDETGIIAVGRADNHGYVLEDRSCRLPAVGPGGDGWATRTVELYHALRADLVVAESNQGGDLVKHTIHTIDPTVPVKLVHASRGKVTRAEPVAAIYEQGRAHHVGALPTLEDQMASMMPGMSKSPDRVDALVWAFWELFLEKDPEPDYQLGAW